MRHQRIASPTPPKITGTRFAGPIRGVDFGPKPPKIRTKTEQYWESVCFSVGYKTPLNFIVKYLETLAFSHEKTA
jgi:hypothetical protein